MDNLSKNSDETPVVVATIVVDSYSDWNVSINKICRDCHQIFQPIGPNTSTRESFRCSACNKRYEKNCLTNTIIGSCCVS